jgi:hypothetical protein
MIYFYIEIIFFISNYSIIDHLNYTCNYQHQSQQVAQAARLVVPRPEGVLELVTGQAPTYRLLDVVVAPAFNAGLLTGCRVNHHLNSEKNCTNNTAVFALEPRRTLCREWKELLPRYKHFVQHDAAAEDVSFACR